ncbi:transposase [uncultured Limimaricola sp.]|uniref:transposase n=1 Tax=uncultured Limimaricola sp. TaxID=2211667 RepID=UPI0030F86F15
MPKKRFSDEQIVFALRHAETGTTVGEICRKMGVSEAMFSTLRGQHDDNVPLRLVIQSPLRMPRCGPSWERGAHLRQ